MKTTRLALSAALAILLGACAVLPHDPAAEKARLLALHEQAMEAHRRSDIAMLFAHDAPDYVLANRGEVSKPTLEQRRQFLGPYLEATRFSEYVDAIPPIVAVSRDGSLGWVIVQVRVKGEQRTASGATRPLAFEAAWIELYEKRDGEWRRVGNVSNFKG